MDSTKLEASRLDPIFPTESLFEARMMQFDQIFEVPPRHSLVLLRHASANGSRTVEEWHHEQRDEAGRLVARYDSFEEGPPRRGRFRKYDSQGRVVAEGELPA